MFFLGEYSFIFPSLSFNESFIVPNNIWLHKIRRFLIIFRLVESNYVVIIIFFFFCNCLFFLKVPIKYTCSKIYFYDIKKILIIKDLWSDHLCHHRTLALVFSYLLNEKSWDFRRDETWYLFPGRQDVLFAPSCDYSHQSNFASYRIFILRYIILYY